MAKERPPQVVAVEALGTAWTVHSLYPDPDIQPAFRRAIETLIEIIEPDMSIDVEGPRFLFDGDEVETEREGAERLARRCFVHHVESIRFDDTPTAVDVAKFFASLAKEEDSVRASGGIAAALRRDGIASMSVVQRTQLRTITEDETVDRDKRVQSVIEQGSDPKEFAAALMEQAGDDPDRLAELGGLHGQQGQPRAQHVPWRTQEPLEAVARTGGTTTPSMPYVPTRATGCATGAYGIRAHPEPCGHAIGPIWCNGTYVPQCGR